MIRFLRSVPRKYYLFGAVSLLIVFYALNFLLPRQVEFSYAGETCHKQFTVLPDLQKSKDSNYNISFKNTLKVGQSHIASMKTCFSAKNAPEPGSKIIGTAPFDGPLARVLYNVTVLEAPVANLRSVKPEIPVSKALIIPMSAADSVHSYGLTVADKQTTCTSNGEAVSCDVPSLSLAQGQEFPYQLTRAFKDSDSMTVGSGTFKTLRAATITGGSVSPGQTVYTKPTTFTFTADKPITDAEASLVVDGAPVPSSTSVKDATITVTLKSELPREKAVELRINRVEAADGSTLVEPYVVPFSTSGGPKVSGVSVGATGVGQSAAIVLTFDQPLSKTKDIVPFIAFAGGNASIQKLSDTQVRVQLAALPLCQPFTITAKPGIPSEYDLPSAKNWSFTGRTICYQATTYGTSLKGRPLTAYLFGSSGPVTMYVGGIHGNEPSSTSLMKAWLNELEANPARFAGKRVLVVPAINPDGLAANTRTNARGVNLNRNFPTDNWVKSIKDTDGSNASGGGDSPLSEPEAAALAKLSTSYRPRLILSFHAIGGLTIGDVGGYSAPYAARYASLVGYRDGTNSGNSNFDYNVSGAYEDWTFSKAGIPSIVIELSSYTSVNIANHSKALWAMMD